MIEGRITHVTPATSQEAAGGIAGTVTISGKLYGRGIGAGDPVARELTILVPASV